MSEHLAGRLRGIVGIATLGLFTFAVPPFIAGSLKANDVLYTVIDLGALGCCYQSTQASAALALNAHGDVAGVTSSPMDPQRMIPFVYQNGTMTAISDDPGWATGINDAGQVTGAVTPAGLTVSHAFLYQSGVLTDIGTLPGYSNDPYALPYAINNSGTIVGDSNAAAFVYENEKMSIMKRMSARAAYAINDVGDIVGLIETPRGEGGRHSNHGFLFSGNTLRDIGTLDGDVDSVSIPVAINRAGQIVGAAWKNGNSEERAFLWEAGVFHELPLLEPLSGYPFHYSAAAAINNRGEIIGVSDGAMFLYRDGALINLNRAIAKDAGGVWPSIWSVSAINDAGQIAGTCYFGGDGAHACLLTPVVANQP